MVCSYFLFLPGSVLEGYTFLRICPFLPGCTFYWHSVACSSLLGCLYFCSVCCNFSFFISNFIDLSRLPLSFGFFLLFIYLFWLCCVFVSVQELSLVAASGGHSSSRCVGLSLLRLLVLWRTGSRHAGSVIVAHGPSCSRGMWDLPGPGLEPVSPALAGRFSTTVPPGEPLPLFLDESG